MRRNPCSTLARRPKAACCGDYPQALLFRVTGRCTVPEWTQQSLDRVGSHGQPPCSRRRGRSTVGGLLKTRCHRYELVGDSQPFTSSCPAGLCIPAEGAASASMRAIQKFVLCRFRAQCQRVIPLVHTGVSYSLTVHTLGPLSETALSVSYSEIEFAVRAAYNRLTPIHHTTHCNRHVRCARGAAGAVICADSVR